MKQQKFFNAKSDFALICSMAEKLNLDKKIVELLFSRGLTTEAQILKFLNPLPSDFNDPFLLNGMAEAVEKIKQTIKNNKRILIFGDYDVDGISATAIMLKTLGKLKVHADYYLPNRFVDGYGLTNEVLDKIKEKFSPELIITVDCGISCAEEVEYAKSIGVDMIITDHHEIPDILPNTIVINPKIKEQKYPFSELCGTGVAFKLSQAILGTELASEFLPIAAIATIADIVSLTEENRAIVATGLSLFDRYLPAGIKLLLRDNKINLKNCSSTDIAFKIAPKINSAGRMGDASDSLLLYIEKDPVVLHGQVEKINNYNIARQKACTEVFDDCVKMLKAINLSNERSIILSSPNWDAGILGIVCARLVEVYNRPAFLFSESEGILKGSARSLNDINIHEILSSTQDILESFGGHKMAAGLRLKKEHLPVFIDKVNQFIFTKVSSKAFTPIYYYDLDMEPEELTDKFYADMLKLEPFGLDNAKPLLKITTDNAKISPLKNFANHYNIILDKITLIYFNCLEKYFSLKYSKNKNFIIEIQGKQENQFKGIVRNFNGDFEFDNSFTASLDAFVFEQLTYLKNKSTCDTKVYSQSDLIKFITNCETSSFGTIFVATKGETYNNFTVNYYNENIPELFVFNNSSDSGYNAIYLYPTDLNIFKNYQKIIFLDAILDKSYLAEIRRYSNAEIYIPENAHFDKKLLATLNLSRPAISNFFIKLKTFEGQKFSNISHLYNSICKTIKIPFNNFYIYYLVFSELNIIKLLQGDQLILQINSKKKTELNNSTIYNMANYLSQISK